MTTRTALGSNKRNASQTQNTGQSFQADRYKLRRASQDMLPGSSVRRCQQRIAFGHEGVQVWTDPDTSWFVGAVPCNLLWACPVCGPRISSDRGEKVQMAIDAGLNQGHDASLITLTFSHSRADFLKESVAGFTKALRRLKSGRVYDGFKKRWGVLGEIRALEVTQGEANGWHVHTHAICFTEFPLSQNAVKEMRAELFAMWIAACEFAGIGKPSEEHGVDMQNAKHAGKYVAKWGFSEELTKSHLKKGKEGRRTPLQILRDAMEGCGKSRWLWREFNECFKGKRQVFWSHGLKKKLQLPEEKEEEPQTMLDFQKLLLTIPPITWDWITEKRAHATVLMLAFAGGDLLQNFLEKMNATQGRFYDGENDMAGMADTDWPKQRTG